MSTELRNRISDAMKDAMKARAKERLAAIRLIQAEFKRIEVDERIEVSDERALAVLDKMLKQRKDSVSQFEAAGRTDLAEVEKAEMAVIQEFLPAALGADELDAIIAAAIAESGASSMREMGAAMALIKPQVAGRADMGEVSKLLKAKLG
ncbi:GatB/YqeY domain-containing protein [Simiduia agarivorans]|uniref:GatB/Yqey domain superfamily protein n=1 Tax=Simiduia agarivorans (strain DSM 21679 / JCM 13881 / BCRC 17597 / SA1) TaxID=1117647 RepID=K4KYX3_SIMAS|nr:GatB/YqeY domain-containing protein [Simiduia agarivorans]AFU99132.1 GatB/Yqey domain superfamily protein [Simiduia agarivorans SA1 = DSM 21679]